jgi:uncharacterized protein (TIGR03435 family)
VVKTLSVDAGLSNSDSVEVKSMKLGMAMALVLCVQGTGFAQVNVKRMEFKVASVKRAAPEGTPSAGGMDANGAGSVSVTGDRASYQGITLKQLLMNAYDLNPSQISGPAWIETERYDVVATIPPGAQKQDIPAMLQRLLADRFQISQHTEKKDEPIYVLGIGPSGPKLKPSSSAHPQTTTGFKIGTTGIATDQAEMKFIGETMADFADSLSGRLDRAVVDQTGLAGRFDITLPVDAKDLQPGSDTLSASLLAAIHSVGLKLDPGKAPAKHLVVDTAQQIPTED